jgi:hypothetical protein
MSNFVEYQNLACHYEPFFPGGVKPQLGGGMLLKSYENHILWLGGTSELCTQLVTFIKDKCHYGLVSFFVFTFIYV